MELVYLLIMFAVVVVAIWLKLPLYLALTASVVTGLFLFQIPFSQVGGILLRGTLGKDTLMMVLLPRLNNGRITRRKLSSSF